MLYIVSTPIGNLKEITYRAVEVLQNSSVIYAEDTRHSKILLNAYQIKTPLKSYHKYNERESVNKIVELLKKGEEVSLISDAGAPLISDPGSILVQTLVAEDLPFTHVSGACALISGLILSGLNTQRFTFIGFLPEKNIDKQKLIEKYSKLDTTLIFYSAPHNIQEDISWLYKILGERKCVAVREISKLHEEREEFNLSQGLSKEPKGEYVLLVEGYKELDAYKNVSVKEQLIEYISIGYTKKEAIKLVAEERNIKKAEVYKISLEIE